MAAHIFDNKSPVYLFFEYQTCNDFLRFSILKHYTRKLKEFTLQYYYEGRNAPGHFSKQQKNETISNEMRYH